MDLRKLIQVKNLSYLEIALCDSSMNTYGIIPIGDQTELDILKRFQENLSATSLSLDWFIEISPAMTESLSTDSPLQSISFHHLHRLEYLSFQNCDIGILKSLPDSLESFTTKKSFFTNRHHRYNWARNLKSINIEHTSMDDNTLIRLSNWPRSLESLVIAGKVIC